MELLILILLLEYHQVKTMCVWMDMRACAYVCVRSKVYSAAWHAAKASEQSPKDCGQLARDARLQYLSLSHDMIQYL